MAIYWGFPHLELQHRLSFVGLQHEAERSDARVWIICFFSVSLQTTTWSSHCSVTVQHKTTSLIHIFSFKTNSKTRETTDLLTVLSAQPSIFVQTHIERGQGLAHALLNEVVCNTTRRMLVENRVHQRDLGRAAPSFSLRWTKLSNGEDNWCGFRVENWNKRFSWYDNRVVRLQIVYLEASEAAATWKANVADVRRAVRRDHFVNNQRSIPQVGPSGQLHLPELL